MDKGSEKKICCCACDMYRIPLIKYRTKCRVCGDYAGAEVNLYSVALAILDLQQKVEKIIDKQQLN